MDYINVSYFVPAYSHSFLVGNLYSDPPKISKASSQIIIYYSYSYIYSGDN